MHSTDRKGIDMLTLTYRIVLPLMICLTFVACAYTPQNTVIDPEIDLVESKEGFGSTVYVKVVDERPDMVWGTEGALMVKEPQLQQIKIWNP